jgi:hypothetical protein
MVPSDIDTHWTSDMNRENRPLDPDYISACLEAAIEISNRHERERLRRVGRIGTGGTSKTGGSKLVGTGLLFPSVSLMARRFLAAWERRPRHPVLATRRTGR